jgi:ABC-type glycerol-3-phosphate transport system permease component
MTTMNANLPAKRLGWLKVDQWVLYLCLFGLALFFLFPLVWMSYSSFKMGADIATEPLSFNVFSATIDNYTSLLRNVPLYIGFKNTAIVLLFKGALTLFFCPLAGFAFAKFKFRGRDALFKVVLATLMLPAVIMLIPLLLEMGMLGWVNTYQALILPGAINAFSIFWMRQQIAEVPDELLDAGRVDGCSTWQLYWKIVVFVIKPSLAALGILTFLDIYNDFVWPVVAVNTVQMQTLQVMLSDLANQINNMQVGAIGQNAWGQMLAASTLATLPILILFMFLQRYFIQGILAGSIKG